MTKLNRRFQARQIRRLYEGASVDLEEVSKLFGVAPVESREQLIRSIVKSLQIECKKVTNVESQMRICCAAILESLQAKHEI